MARCCGCSRYLAVDTRGGWSEDVCLVLDTSVHLDFSSQNECFSKTKDYIEKNQTKTLTLDIQMAVELDDLRG